MLGADPYPYPVRSLVEVLAIQQNPNVSTPSKQLSLKYGNLEHLRLIIAWMVPIHIFILSDFMWKSLVFYQIQPAMIRQNWRSH